MTGQADCPQCGAAVVTHADRCPQCGYVPGSVDGWRPIMAEPLEADGPVKVVFDARDRIRIGAEDVGLELSDLALFDFDGQLIDAPRRLDLKPGLGPELAFPGRRASRLWCHARLLGKGPAVLQIYERP